LVLITSIKLDVLREKNKYDEPQLLVMLANDSQYAFQVLFNKYKNHIYKVAGLYLKSPSLAEEVLQDVFLKVWINRKAMMHLNSFESWLYTVSKNLILNYNKRLVAEWKARENYCVPDAGVEDNADHKIRASQYQQLLQKALSQLPEQQQAVYKLAREQHLSYKEIAEQLSISTLTVKTHMARALGSIRAYLKSNGDSTFIILFLIQSNLF
jgi:RNA polymerase sigma-70 factor (family 1)